MSAVPATSDRYLSFKGIDFDGQARRMIDRITAHTQGKEDVLGLK